MATYSNLNSLFKDIANSIRSKTGSTAAIVANNFPTAINAISTGTNTADANATAADILSPKTAYVNGSKLTGSIATKTASNLSASGATVTAEAGYYASAVSKSVASGSATTPATTVYTGKVGMSFNASNGVVTASSVSGTASVTPTVSAGYVSAGTAGTITATSNANTYSVGLASINAPSGSAKQSKPGLAFNASNGVVTATVAATSGTAYANVATAGYIAAGAKSGTFTMSAADSNTISVGLASINTPSGSKQQSTPAVTLYANGLVSATSAATSGTAYANVATAGYIAAGAKSGTFSLTASAAGTKQLTTQAGGTTTITGNTKIVANQTFTTGDVYATVAAATRSAGTAAVLNNSNGNVRYYVNTTAGYTAANTTAYYLQLNTKAGGTTTGITTTATTLINAGQFAIGDIKAQATAGTLAAGTAAVLNNSNGNIRYYRNVSAAGYIAANTTAYYLQLNTKAGSTTTVGESETTLVNAGQFVTGAIKAKSGPTLKIGDLSPTKGTGMIAANGAELSPTAYLSYTAMTAPLYTATTLKAPALSGSYYQVSPVRKIYDYYFCFATVYASSTYYVYLYRTNNLTVAPTQVETVWSCSVSSISTTGFCSDFCVHDNKIYFISTASSRRLYLNVYTVSESGSYTKSQISLGSVSSSYTMSQSFSKENTCYWNGYVFYYMEGGLVVVCDESGLFKTTQLANSNFTPGARPWLIDAEHSFIVQALCGTTGSSYNWTNASFYHFYDIINSNSTPFAVANLGVHYNVTYRVYYNNIVRTGNRIWIAGNNTSKFILGLNLKDLSCNHLVNYSYNAGYNFGLNVVGNTLYVTADSRDNRYNAGTSSYNGFITWAVGENTPLNAYGYGSALNAVNTKTSDPQWNVYYKYLVGPVSSNTYTAYNVNVNKIVKVPDMPEMYIKVS